MKIIVTLVALLVTFASVPPASAAPVDSGDELARLNLLSGQNFQPGEYLDRESACSAISKVFIGVQSETSLPFADLNDINAANIPYIAALYDAGILKGSLAEDGVYMLPSSRITRQDLCTLLGRLLEQTDQNMPGFTDDSLIAPYALPYVSWFAANKSLTGYPDGSFGPTNDMTASELAFFVTRAYDYQAEKAAEKMPDIATVAGNGMRGQSDGDKLTASFTMPCGVIPANDGNLTLIDTYNNMIRSVDGEKVSTISGRLFDHDDYGLPHGYYLDTYLKDSLLNRPAGGVYSSQRELFIADSGNNVIRFVRQGRMYTFSGTTEGFADGTRNAAKFNCPMAIAMDGADNVYVADTLNNRIRKIAPDGAVTTIAGSGKAGYADGASADATFFEPQGIAVTPDGSSIYVADTGSHRLRLIRDDTVTTIAGTTTESDSEGSPIGGFADGEANAAMLDSPAGLALYNGILLVCDSGNNRIRALVDGRLITIAGNGEPGDSAGSPLNYPAGISVADGVLYIADTRNNKIKALTITPDLFS